MTISKTSKVYGDISQNLQGLLEGVVVVLDPSAGSSSSMPGYAVYKQSEYVHSGTFKLPLGTPLPVRLRTLNNLMRKLYSQYEADVLIYEDIPAQRHGMGNAEAHASLLKALGVILSVPGPEGYVGIYPVSWKKMTRDTYQKGDEADAVEIGYIVLEEAARIAAELRIKKGKGKK